MSTAAIIQAAPAVACRPWPRHELTPDAWVAMAAALPAAPSLDLLALWADTASVHALFADGAHVLPASVPVADGGYPALSPHRPAAVWFERMVHDLWGHQAVRATDLRPWLDHGRWAQPQPMALRPAAAGGPPEPPEFLPMAGEDLHQLPLGPVRGGIAEPAHLRVTASGETVVRLEARLGYAHKGTLVLMRGKPPRAAARYAARLSGDSTVAHAIAFARAAEAALAQEAPPRADALRAVMGELERIANHLADIGATCGEAGFAAAAAHCGRLREMLLRGCMTAFGHRLMMDCVVPGGVAADVAPGGAEAVVAALMAVQAELPQLRDRYGTSASVLERTAGIGIIAPAMATAFAAGGPVGRASGRIRDVRRIPGYPPFSAMAVPAAQSVAGDANARLCVRVAEIGDSIALLHALLERLPDGPLAVPLPVGAGEGIGIAEGFRGDIWHWLRLDNGVVAAAFMRDPSWPLWPLLEHAAIGADVADLPLIERSINPSCSGVDL